MTTNYELFEEMLDELIEANHCNLIAVFPKLRHIVETIKQNHHNGIYCIMQVKLICANGTKSTAIIEKYERLIIENEINKLGGTVTWE